MAKIIQEYGAAAVYNADSAFASEHHDFLDCCQVCWQKAIDLDSSLITRWQFRVNVNDAWKYM